MNEEIQQMGAKVSQLTDEKEAKISKEAKNLSHEVNKLSEKSENIVREKSVLKNKEDPLKTEIETANKIRRGLHGLEAPVLENFPAKKYSDEYFSSLENAHCQQVEDCQLCDVPAPSSQLLLISHLTRVVLILSLENQLGYDVGENKRVPAWCDRILYQDNRLSTSSECSLDCPVVGSILQLFLYDGKASNHNPRGLFGIAS